MALLVAQSVLASTSHKGAPATSDITPQEAMAINTYKKASPAVVHITTQAVTQNMVFGLVPSEGTGSGCILTADGYILTNFHVIKGAQTIRVKLADGTTLPAKLIGGDEEYDLAVIKVDSGARKLTPVQLGDSSKLEVGRQVYVISNPFGYELSMSHGIVSSLGRTINLPNGRTLKGLIQTDAAINPQVVLCLTIKVL